MAGAAVTEQRAPAAVEQSVAQPPPNSQQNEVTPREVQNGVAQIVNDVTEGAITGQNALKELSTGDFVNYKREGKTNPLTGEQGKIVGIQLDITEKKIRDLEKNPDFNSKENKVFFCDARIAIIQQRLAKLNKPKLSAVEQEEKEKLNKKVIEITDQRKEFVEETGKENVPNYIEGLAKKLLGNDAKDADLKSAQDDPLDFINKKLENAHDPGLIQNTVLELIPEGDERDNVKTVLDALKKEKDKNKRTPLLKALGALAALLFLIYKGSSKELSGGQQNGQ